MHHRTTPGHRARRTPANMRRLSGRARLAQRRTPSPPVDRDGMTREGQAASLPAGANRQPFSHFVRGVAILMASVVMTQLGNRIGIDKRLFGPLLLCLAMVMIVSAGIRAGRSIAANRVNTWMHTIWWCLLAWSALTILRGVTMDRFGIYMWGISLYAWAWAVPVCMWVGADPAAWHGLFRLNVVLISIGMVFEVLLMLLGLRGELALFDAAPFLAVVVCYLPARHHKIIWLGAVLCLMVALLRSGRNMSVSTATMVLAGICIALVKRGHGSWARRIVAFAVLSTLTIGIYHIATSQDIWFLSSRNDARIEAFKEELPQNTRWGRHNIYAEFLNDVTGLDLAIGRGCMGSYRGWRGPAKGWKQRREIECGYFQAILKGGVVMLVLMLLLLVPAAVLGLFDSRNWFARGCAIIVWIRLGEMVAFGLPNANVRYVLVWLAAGGCLSARLRHMGEDEMDTCLQALTRPPDVKPADGRLRQGRGRRCRQRARPRPPQQ